MPYIKINEIDIYYEIHGQGEPILFISGAGGDITYWQLILNELIQHNKIILFDFRDAGRSGSSNYFYSIDALAKETKQLLDALSIKKVHILGHSMGGMVAQQFAYQFPHLVDKLILYSTTAKANIIAKLALTLMSELKQQEENFNLLVKTFSAWCYSNVYLSKEENNIENIIKISKNKLYPQSQKGYAKQIKATCDFNSSSWISTINTKTLVIAGKDDLLFPVSESVFIKELIQNSKIKIILDAAHCAHIEKTKQFVETVLDFL